MGRRGRGGREGEEEGEKIKRKGRRVTLGAAGALPASACQLTQVVLQRAPLFSTAGNSCLVAFEERKPGTPVCKGHVSMN
ncbi:hypothetical protein Pmani_033703 [Petrolisthes manimaculis]|uniref:Uncharacterized protein n=1 Tax=Petrolisthes manimaculis TaxID=1843537 RepID=A0AAE1NQV0_9EUCA|nr:hypothetical protein Pmani_033703 [Petrolisthes manimaculis]